MKLLTFFIFLVIGVMMTKADGVPSNSASGAGRDLSKVKKVVGFYIVRGIRDPFYIDASKFDTLPLERTPVFTSDDMEKYDISTHTFQLKNEALKKFNKVEIGAIGRPVVVTIGDRRVYFAAFWSFVSSTSWDGVRIEACVPGTNCFQIRISPVRADPRNDPEMLEILKSIGN